MGLKMWPMSGPVHLLERSVAMYASYCIESRRVCLILFDITTFILPFYSFKKKIPRDFKFSMRITRFVSH